MTRIAPVALAFALGLVPAGQVGGAVNVPPPAAAALSERTVAVNGVALRVIVGGSGSPPLVIVHGGPGLGADYLVPHFARLADSRRLVFYDQRGCGGSSGDEDPAAMTMDTQVADLEVLRAALGIERMALAGQSFGALVAITYTAAHPERVAALLLLEPAPGASEYIPQFSQTIQTRLSDAEKAEIAALAQSEAFQRRNPAAFCRFMTLRFGAYYFDRSAMARHNLAYLDTETVRKFFVASQAFAPYMTSFDVHPLLARFACPTLIVRGDHDPIPAASAERLQQGIAGSRLIVLPKCGHFAHIEAEEPYFAAIEEFLAASAVAGAH